MVHPPPLLSNSCPVPCSETPSQAKAPLSYQISLFCRKLKTLASKTLQLFHKKKESETRENHLLEYLRTLNPDVSRKDLKVVAKFLIDQNITVIKFRFHWERDTSFINFDYQDAPSPPRLTFSLIIITLFPLWLMGFSVNSAVLAKKMRYLQMSLLHTRTQPLKRTAAHQQTRHQRL
jgi:hypothetical protein